MAQSAQCLLPTFGTTTRYPKRPASVRAKTTATQNSRLVSAFENNSLDSILKTAWALLLYRYTGLVDVCFGYQHHGSDGMKQTSSVTDRLLTCKLTIDEGDSIGMLLRKSEEASLSADDVGLSRGPDVPRDDHLLFNTIVMVRVCGDRANEENSVRPVLPTTLAEECRARLHVKVLQEEVCIFIEWWNTDVSATQMESITRYFEQLLERVLWHENTAAADAGCFLEHDWSRVLEFNSVLPEASDRCIHDVIHENASLHPNREAVCAWDGSFTYEELDGLASRLAYHLQAHGVVPEARVALCFDKSKWHVVAMLGVMKAGGAFLSLDPAHPTSRLRSLVDSVSAEMLICSRNRASSLEMVVDSLIPLDDELFNKASSPPGGFIERNVKCDNAAYLIFTSGSTGRPKGTLLEHRAFVSAAMAYGEPMGLHQNCRMLQFAAHTFDASTYESISPLLHGGTVCIPGEEERLNDVAQAINRMRVNTLCLTPSFIRFIDPSTVPVVRTVILAGEAMSRADLERWSHIKLVNAYGPSESAVCAALNNKIDMDTDCRDIGLPTGVHFWVVDPNNHNQLVPVGTPGELLLEGPTLARCYLHDPQKTEEAFIYNPAWAKYDTRRGDRRFYKTGDLVRYSSDSGSLIFIGRKDLQIKLHGQRIELGEIENHISTLAVIKHALTFFCKSGVAKGKLVAVVSLQGKQPSRSRSLELLSKGERATAVAEIREELAKLIPTYMIPSVWLCVEALPLLPSGKLDRKEIVNWAVNQTDDIQSKCSEADVPQLLHIAPSDLTVEDRLASIWSRVLAIPKNKFKFDEGFLAMGGDSIAAITCMGYCKKQGMGVTVRDVLQSKSIRDLATRVKEIDLNVEYREATGEPFNLSPIQKLHFMVRREGQGYFNQGIRTRLSRRLSEDDLRNALGIIVERHSMLRARLLDVNNFGRLQQVITEDASYRLQTHSIRELSEMESVIALSQSCINALIGPIMSVDLFYTDHGCFLSMVAHHLVVDIVSWRIILEDLEDVLLRPEEKASQTNSLPFSTWLRLQEERTVAVNTEASPLPAPDFAYWGLENQTVTYGDVACEAFELDLDDSHLILMGCHESLGTEPIDVLLAALLYSFGQVFQDRSLPVIHNEGHGREVWDQKIDISRTVGWFTTLSPISVPRQATNDPVELVMLVKDLRRRAADNGRQQFATLMASLAENKKITGQCQMEMSFNYVGQHRDLQRQDALFQLMNQMAGETGQGGGASDFGKETPRFALFEVSALAVNGKLRFIFSFSKYMKHQETIRTWVSTCGDALRSLGKALESHPTRPTLSDFPMFSLTYPELENILSKKLPSVGVSSVDLVEDIYPCSRMQQGILLARSRDSTLYAVHVTYEALRAEGKPDVEKFLNAWRLVVSRHAVLRTLFVENLTSRDLFAQVVLKSSEPSTGQLACLNDGDVISVFDKQLPVTHSENRPHHRITTCQTESGRLFFRLEISHAAMDAMSISIILKDLELAYDGKLDECRPSFKKYIEYLHSAPHDKSTEYWRTYLEGIKPCLFPRLTDGKDVSQKQLRTMRLNFDIFSELQSVCEAKGLTISTAFTAAWGLTVRLFCNTDDVCFSYMTSLRDAEAKDIESVVGPVINLLACRMKFIKDQQMLDILQRVQSDCIEQLPHNSLAFIDIAHQLKLPDPALLNTGVSFQRATKQNMHSSPGISFSRVGAIQDPAEYPLFINVVASDKAAEVEMNYWTNMLSDQQAENVFSIYLKYLKDIVHHHRKQVSQLETLSDWNKQRIRKWKKQPPEESDLLVQDVIGEKAISQPDAVAISGLGDTLTYAGLERLSSCLAVYLSQLGIRAGTPVPMYFSKSVWQTVAILAIFKVGGICVPRDTAQPEADLNKWLIDHGAHVALASASGGDSLEGLFPVVVTIDKSLFENLPTRITLDFDHIQSHSDAYVVMNPDDSQASSAILLSQRAILARADAFASAAKMTSSTKTLQFASLTSDMFLQEVIGTFLCGGCVCIPKSEALGQLAESIEATNANFMTLSPTIASIFHPSDVPSLESVALFGEIMPDRVEKIWSGKVQLHSFFGTAECSSTCIQRSELTCSDNTTFIETSSGCCSWIVDTENSSRLVPIGCVGELVIEGPALSRYLYGEERTNERFIELDSQVANSDKRPFVHSPQQRRHMFRTGHLARYNSDGTLVYLGKKGNLRNQKAQITAFEVEQYLQTMDLHDHRCIVEATDLGNEEYPNTCVAVFILPAEYQQTRTDGDTVKISLRSATTNELMVKVHAFLAASLSASQVPDLYFPVQGLRLTQLGTIDRALLKQWASDLTVDSLLEYDLRRFSEFWRTELEKPPHAGQLLQPLFAQDLPPAPEIIDRGINIPWGGSVQRLKSMDVLRCAWALALYSYTMSDDIIFGEILPDHKDSITGGTPLQAAILPRRILIDNSKNIFQLLDRTASSVTRAQPYQNASISAIRNLNADTARACNFETALSFSHLSADKQNLHLERLEGSTNLHSEFSVCPLVVLCVVEDDNVQISARYDSRALYRSQVEQLIFLFEICLGVSQSPTGLDIKIGDLEQLQRCQSLPDFNNTVSYWRTYLADVEPCLFLVLSPKKRQDRSKVESMKLGNVPKIHRTCSDRSISPSLLLQTVWALVLRAYTGLEEAGFGYQASAECGPSGIVPGRFILNDARNLRDIMQKRKSDMEDMINHQMTLSEIHRSVGSQDAPLFNTAFGYGVSSIKSADVYRTDEYLIIINADVSESSAKIDFEYQPSSLSSADIGHIIDCFEHTLDSALTVLEQNGSIGDLEFLGQRSHRALSAWNSALPEPPKKPAHEIFQEQVFLQHSATAICSWDEEFTYAQLDNLSTKLAYYLMDRGARPEVFVGMCFEKSAWAVIAQLAVLKAGGAFVFLDASHPESRLQGLVDDLATPIMLCSPRHSAKVSRICKMALTVDRDALDQIPSPSTTKKLPTVKGDNAAYAIFTSGTTGKPKATVLDHAALAVSASSFKSKLGMNSGIRALQFSSFTFDVSVMETIIVLVTGGCVCIPSDEERLNDLTGAIRRMGANSISCTPSVTSTLDPSDVPTVQFVMNGGEKLTEGQILRWGDRRLVNAYGPSEATIVATASLKIDRDGVRLDGDCNSIGTAVSGRTWIVDPHNHNRLLPVGAVGELVLEGHNIARGYLNNEKKTKEVFITNPSWSQERKFKDTIGHVGRMYRTGDLVRYKSDGNICFISRMDTQVKLNGQRVELEEIEHQCASLAPPTMKVAVDVVVPDTKNAVKSLVAFFARENSDMRSTASQGVQGLLLPLVSSDQQVIGKLHESLGRVLPQIMIPRLYFPVRCLPLGATGKLDRKALRAAVESLPREQMKPYMISNFGSNEPIEQAPQVELNLRALWAEALGVESRSIKAEDSFFGLGGDSFAAMKLVGIARSQDISLTVAKIYEYPILGDMVKYCETGEKPAESVTPGIAPFSLLSDSVPLRDIMQEVTEQCGVDEDAISDVYPCSAMQEGLLTLSIRNKGAYVARTVWRLDPNVDLERFKAAWQKVIDEYDILRTRIVHTDAAGFLQVVVKKERLSWTLETALENVTDDDVGGNGGLLAKYAIVQLGSSLRYFVWTMNHALYDGWNVPPMMRRVEEIYLNSSPTQNLTVPYKSFINHLLQCDIEQSDDFWKSYMDGLSCEPFPPLKTTGSNIPRKVGFQKGSVDISRMAGATDITVPELIRSAWAIVLSVHTGSGDVCFGEALMGRNIDMPGITDVAGPVLTTVPMRIRVDNKNPVIEYLHDVRKMTAAMIPHQHLGLQRIRKLSSDAALGCNSQNLLVIQSENGGGLNKNIWTSENHKTRDDFFTHSLVLECEIAGSELHIKALHDEAVLGPWKMERLVAQFGFVLEQLLSIPEGSSMTVGAVDVASPLDKRDISHWNQRQVTSVDRCAHDIIRKHALIQPQAPAICSWDGGLDYQKLLELASSFAAYLVSCGVGPETFVPICLDKSIWAVVTILSVLIAGGAFVPLDPSHPTLRHKEIMEEIEAEIILCSPQFRSRYLGTVGTIIPVSKDTITAYSSVASVQTPNVSATSANMAYAIFTSGSTGQPKGIIIDHRAICSSIIGFAPSMELTKHSRVLQFASLTFDASVLEILGTLMLGGCICVPSEDERLNDIPGAIQRMDVSWAVLTPSIASILVPSPVPSLKVLALGGEALTREAVQKWGSQVTLLGAYGPAEASIVGLVNDDFVNHGFACIGYGTPSTLTWVVDPDDHDRLTPLGAVGELALEGPALAREYLNNPEKTANAFIVDPVWIQGFSSSSALHRRIYKTGDLVRYNSNGSLEYLGRKDHQVKLHGQRMELGEIEHRLRETQNVRNAVVILPQTGPLKQRLVVVLSLDSLTSKSSMITTGACELVSQRSMAEVGYRAAKGVQTTIKAHLPVYMVPKAWAVVKSIPMLVSGKLDRKRVTTWLEHLEESVYDRIIQDFDYATPDFVVQEKKRKDEEDAAPVIIREVFAQVLNIPVDEVNPNESFISSGGDSITGMTVVTKARKRGLKMPLDRVLQAKSIDELATYCEMKNQPRQMKVEQDSESFFALSPIQDMFLRSLPALPKGSGRFNQSITVRLTKRTKADVIESAVRAVVQKHSMFRARFSETRDGVWQQRITKDIGSSYTFRTQSVKNSTEMQSKIAESQFSLDVQKGAVLAADIFEIDRQQVFFLVASHLCVDVVSWRLVLQDIEDFLDTGSLSSEMPLSFQSWCRVQSENTKSINGTADIPYEVPNIGFWGMNGKPNHYEHVNMESFILDKDTTAFVSRQCHNILRTETIEVLLAAVLQSFKNVFTEREVPTIYNEGHGREAWDSADPSGTVGWFTTLSPLHVQGGSSLLETMKRVKDTRRQTAAFCRAFFARSVLHSEKDKKFPVPLEVTFNYLGQLQQLEREDSIFQHYGDIYSAERMSATSDMGPETPRFSLFEVSAVIVKEQLHVSFTYNRNMRHQTRIQAWKTECQRVLEVEMSKLRNVAPEPTLSDYPLLPITYDGLQDLTRDVLPNLGITHVDQIEDIYPCSPIQEGIIFSQLRDPHEYIFNAVFELRGTGRESTIDIPRLKKAWSSVVSRHPVLRTTFIESSCKEGSFDQVVLKHASETTVEIVCDDANALSKLGAVSLLNNDDNPDIYHQLVFCQTSTGRVLMKLEMNHVIMDGGSHSILLKELALAYNNQLPSGSGPLFSDYIKYLKEESSVDSLKYWKQHLSGVRSCHLPVADSKNGARQLSDHMVTFDRYAKLQTFCETNSVTFANLILAVWATVLRSYTKSDDICFGYPSTGRDLPVAGVQDALGIFINTLCCRVEFGSNQSLQEVAKSVQETHIRSLAHQRTSLAEIQHALGVQGEPLFNTCVSIQNHANMKMEVAGISYELQQAHDPSEFPLTANVLSARGHEGILLRYWADAVSETEAADLARAIARVLDCFLDEPSMPVLNLDARDKKEYVPTEQHVDRQSLEKIVDERVKLAISQILGESKLVTSRAKGVESAIMNGFEKGIESSFQELIVGKAVTSAPAPQAPIDETTQSEVEKQLWRLWSTTLELKPQPVKHNDSFFKLGGDSITAMKMVRAARDEGLKLSVADVIKYPVFRNLVAVIIDKTTAVMPSVVPKYEEMIESPVEDKSIFPRSESPQDTSFLKPIEFDDISLRAAICPKVGVFKGGIVDVLPVTDFQSLSLTATMFESRWMLTYFYLDGKGSLDIRRLRESFLRVVDAFDILRSVFVCFHGQFFQVVLRKIRPDTFVHETDKSLDEYTNTLQQRDRNMHMGQGEQYLQFYVVRKTNSDEHRILMRIHHAQYDGICLPKIMTAIKMAYEGSPVSPSSFLDYMRLLPGHITPEHYRHWSTLLQGSKMTEIIRRDRPNTFQHIGGFEQQSKITEIPSTATENVTVATVMQSAWAITLAKLCALDDVVFGLTVNGRNGVPGSENTVGPCLNFIPIRVRFRDRWTALDLFRFLQDQQVANMTYESLGFREIIRRCTDWPESTFFSTSILHQNVDYEGQMQLDNNTYRMGGAGVIDNLTDLMLFSKPIAGKPTQITVSLGYSVKGPIHPSFISMVLEMVCDTAQSLVANPNVVLPSPSTLRSLPSQLVEDTPAAADSDSLFLSSLNNRSLSEILAHSDLITRIWQQVLQPRSTTHASRPQTSFQLDSSFFRLGGDIVSMAQVSWILEQETGLHIRLEDLLAQPTFLGQMGLLASEMTERDTEDVDTLDAAPAYAPVDSSRTVSLSGNEALVATSASGSAKSEWSAFDKARLFAKKITRLGGLSTRV